MCELCYKETEFVNLHNHPASKDTFGRIETFPQKARELGQRKLAKTDHGGAHGHDIVFTKACEKHGVEPIYGTEAYIKIDTHYISEIFTKFGVQVPDKKYHITLLAKDDIGYANIIELNNISKRNKLNTITFSDIYKNAQGVYVLTGCVSSPFQQLDLQVSKWLLDQVLSNIDREQVFIETHVIQNKYHAVRAYDLALHSNLYNITTNDAHFASKNHGKFHKDFCDATMNYSFDSHELYLATAKDILKRCHDYDFDSDLIKFVYKGIKNAVRLADKITSYQFKQEEPYLPPLANAKSALGRSVYKSFVQLKNNLNNEEVKLYRERIKEELNVIGKTGYEGYFLILKDVVDFAKNNDIAVGNGRGSAVGSLVVFLLGLTKIDPMKHDLPFARFLSEERITMPDIDIDFGSSGGQKVVDYFCEKYGAVQVAAYDTFSTKSILLYFSKVFNLPFDTSKKARELEQEPEDNKYLQLLFSRNAEFKDFFDTIYTQVKGQSKHPGGVVILPPNKEKMITPLELSKDGNLVISYSEGVNRSDLSYMGLVKFDILKIKAIEAIDYCERNSKEKRPDIDKIPSEVYDEIFAKGKTASVFQFGSDGIRRYLIEVKPTKFSDVVDVNALHRASTMEAGTTKAYAKSRKSGVAKTYKDATINSILSPTGGHIIYQEQFMQLYAYATNVSFAKSDNARRAIVKAKEDAIEVIKKEFVNGLQQKGVEQHIINEIWEEIYAQRKYSFNKAHAVAYATVALHMAYYKWKYPVIFAASALNTRPKQEWMEIIMELMMEDIEIVSPTVNSSSTEFTSDNGKLYAPLGIIKGFGEKAVQHIVEVRKDGLYKDVEDLINRTQRRSVNKTHIRIIVELGLLGYTDIDKVYELLKIKKDEDKFNLNKSYVEAKENFTDLIIPPKGVITLIKNNQRIGNIVGYVVAHDKKKSKKDYNQYVLSPSRIIRVYKQDGEEIIKNLTLIQIDAKHSNNFVVKRDIINVNKKY